MAPTHERRFGDASVPIDEVDLRPVERERLERLLDKIRSGQGLRPDEKQQLRTIVARHHPQAKDWKLRNVVKLALSLVGGAAAGVGLVAILASLLQGES